MIIAISKPKGGGIGKTTTTQSGGLNQQLIIKGSSGSGCGWTNSLANKFWEEPFDF